MRVRKRVAALFLVATMSVSAVAASGCGVATAPPPTWNSPQVDLSAEFFMAKAIKDARWFWGKHELTLHGTLTDKARAWSHWMSTGGCGGGRLICHSTLSHGINGVVHWTLLGENVGVGGADLVALWNAFAGSAGHNANILDYRWNYVGVGVIESGGRHFVTMEFMRV